MIGHPRKELHIVFKTLNFLFSERSSPFRLSADEEKMLIALARHHGPRGIYPSFSTLCREVHRDHRNARRTIERLEQKCLISVDRTNGRSNMYYLHIPDAELSTTQGVHAPLGADTQGVHASDPGRPRPRTQGVHAPQSIHIINTEEERERLSVQKIAKQPQKPPARVPLPPGWRPAPGHARMADRKGGSELLARKFANHAHATAMTSADWNASFENFVMNERSPVASTPQEIRSTVPEWGPGHPVWEERRRYGMLGHGGSDNETETQARPATAQDAASGDGMPAGSLAEAFRRVLSRNGQSPANC